MTPPGFCGPR
ncbi:uncharacterized protein FFE2_15977 [Fusarium fujikuroi]|nr:uncharacterized protein FFE2_15977 [Fusarium fujikuroi]